MRWDFFTKVCCAGGVVALTSGCFFAKESKYPVNTHDSTPVSQRADQNEYARIKDRTPLVAFEYGRCETNDDCAPRGCERSVCAPKGLASTCITDAVGECLSTVPSELCGCTDEGVCRWTRNHSTMTCAGIGAEPASSLPFAGGEHKSYPWRPDY